MTEIKKGDYGSTDDPLAAAAKYSTGPMLCTFNGRIKGTIIADQSGKLRIFQGALKSKTDDYVTEIAFSAGVAAGDGEGWTVDCIGQWCRIEIENDSGFDMTEMRMGWKFTV